MKCRLWVRLVLLTCFFFLFPCALIAGDWLHWRGPEQTGVSRDKDLPERWSPDPQAADNNLLWKMPYGCRSTPLILNGRVYLINNADQGVHEQERVMCFDADTGKVLWEHRFNVFHTDIVSSRVGWTNLAGDAETGNVYAHGVQGLLFCFNRDGRVLWSRSLTEEYGRVTGYGGRVTTPTVDGDLVIVGMINASWGEHARGGNRYLALDKRTGTPVWWSEPPGQFKGTYYSCPVVAVLGGQRLLITGGADGAVHALKVRTGEHVWSYPFGAIAINSSPVVEGNRVYISHGEESEGTNIQGRIICLDASKMENRQPALVWKVDGIKAGYASPIIHEGRLYVCSDSARLYCLDGATGKTLWNFTYGRLARGSPVWADGKIYVADVNAKFHILKPGPDRCQRLHEQTFLSATGTEFIETNGTPAIANGRIYFTTRDEIYCIGKKGHQAKADPIPMSPAEAPANPKAKATHLQVVPADIVLQPGESAGFRVRAFDAQGHFLKEVQATWSLPSPPPPPGSQMAPPPLRGEINTGKLTVAKEVPGQQGTVLAKAEGLEARARVRVVRPLPFAQNFDNVPEGRTPAGWVNSQGKFAVTKLKDGSVVLKKLATDARPPLARANAYMGLPQLTDYTLQADVRGTQKRENLPDIGIVANRYTLMLDGNKQQLRILSWEALPRVDKSIRWEWKPETWYRMRLMVKVEGNKALVRGKVWPRDESEPTTWSIEFDDPTPNREGSPALYGYATGILEDEPGAEIFYDNVSVTPNKN